MDELQKEADNQRRQQFIESYRENAKQVAIAEAKKEAAQKSGLQRLRAENRTRRLTGTEGPRPGSFMEKLSDFTKKNQARMKANLERTAAMRKAAEEEKTRRTQQRIQERQARMTQQPTIGNSRPKWKM